jgi:hypothetical protein
MRFLGQKRAKINTVASINLGISHFGKDMPDGYARGDAAGEAL